MDKKGEVSLALMFTVFIGVLVGLLLFLPVAQNIGTTTQTVNAVNSTVAAPAAGVTIAITGQELIDTPEVYNASGGELINSANYTIDEGVIAGIKTVRYTTAASSEYASQNVNVTYEYGPDGYAEDAGTRSIINLIAVFMALMILAVAMSPIGQSKLMEMMGK
jgi:hypothetical protein